MRYSPRSALRCNTSDLAVKWAHHNIQVNAIRPEFFVTPINFKMFDKNRDQVLREIPLGRTGGDDDLKGIVVRVDFVPVPPNSSRMERVV